jgi:DNA polymerase-1
LVAVPAAPAAAAPPAKSACIAEQATEAAATAAGLMFRDLAIDFPLNISVVRSYADAGKPGAERPTPDEGEVDRL